MLISKDNLTNSKRIEGGAMKGVACQYFKDLSGNLYKKETDYANRSWWYLAEFEYGYVLIWRVHDGRPDKKLTPCCELDLYN